LVCGIDYLHNKKIFHGDIKLDNFLIDYDGRVKVSDVGCSRYIPEDDFASLASKAPGAQSYKAPEVIVHERQLGDYRLQSEEEKTNNPMKDGLKKESLYLADSWSLGLTMLELCILNWRPVDPTARAEDIQKRLNNLRKIAEGKGYRKQLLDLIFGLLNLNAKERLKIAEVKFRLEKEQEFQTIITEEFKASLGLAKQNNQDETKELIDNFYKV